MIIRVHDVEEDRRVEEDGPDDRDVAEHRDLHARVERQPEVQVRVRGQYPVVQIAGEPGGQHVEHDAEG